MTRPLKFLSEYFIHFEPELDLPTCHLSSFLPFSNKTTQPPPPVYKRQFFIEDVLFKLLLLIRFYLVSITLNPHKPGPVPVRTYDSVSQTRQVYPTTKRSERILYLRVRGGTG